MVSVHVDDSELRNLYVDLRGAPMRVQFAAGKAIRRGAIVMDEAMRDDANGHRYLPHLHRAVSHEMIGPLSAEIGLSPGGQGSLAHIIVYGSVNNAPVYDHTSGPRRRLPIVADWMGDAGEESVLGGEK